MPTHRETRVLPYTPNQMFALVSNIKSYPEFLPWCTSARIISQDADLIVAELTIGYKMLRERFVSRVHLDPENLTINVNYISGPLKTLRNEWQFKTAPKKHCQIEFFVHFEFSNPLLGALMNMFFDVAFLRMVNSFEKRAAEIYKEHA